MKKNNYQARLNQAMKAAAVTQAELAFAIGVSQPSIWKLTNGLSKSSRKTVEIAKFLNVSPEWLASGNGEMLALAQSKKKVSSELSSDEEWNEIDGWDDNSVLPIDEVEVPFFKDIEFSCGAGSYSESHASPKKLRFSKLTLNKVGAEKNNVICCSIYGDSMNPVLPQGSTIAINLADKKIVDGKIYAINQDGWKRVKYLYRSASNRVIIRSVNRMEYPDEEINLDELEIIGRIFWSSVVFY